MENVTVMQLADAIRAASEEVPWSGGPAGDEYWRQIALRTQGNLRRSGTAGPTIDRTRVLAALGRVKAANERLA